LARAGEASPLEKSTGTGTVATVSLPQSISDIRPNTEDLAGSGDRSSEKHNQKNNEDH